MVICDLQMRAKGGRSMEPASTVEIGSNERICVRRDAVEDTQAQTQSGNS